MKSAFQHHEFTTTRNRGSPSTELTISDEELAAYAETVRGKCTELLGAISSGDQGTLLASIESFINIIRPGVKIPDSVFGDATFLSTCLDLLTSVDDARLVNEMAWLLARLTCFSDLDNSMKDVDSLITRRFVDMCKSVDPARPKVWFLFANIAPGTSYAHDFWKVIPSLIPALERADHLANAVMMVLANSCNSLIVTKSERDHARFRDVMLQVLNLIRGYLSPGASPACVELARRGLFFVGDILGSSKPFDLDNECLAFITNCALCGNPLVMEPALAVLYFHLCKVERACELPVAQLWDLAVVDRPSFEAVQYEAMQVARLYYEFHPDAVVQNAVIPYVLEHCDDVPFRMQFQLRWILADFLYFMDFNVLSEYAAASGVAPDVAVTMLGQFLIDGSSDPTVAYMTMWAFMGLKWAFARFGNMEAWEGIAGSLGIDDFITSCGEMENGDLNQIIDYYAKLDELLPAAPELQARLESGVAMPTQPVKIRFVLGSS